ncbi:unnamed protein product, partial [Musa textilis]
QSNPQRSSPPTGRAASSISSSGVCSFPDSVNATGWGLRRPRCNPPWRSEDMRTDGDQ